MLINFKRRKITVLSYFLHKKVIPSVLKNLSQNVSKFENHLLVN